MKKIFLTIFMFLLFPLFSFANDSQYYLGEKYRNELNRYIDKNINKYYKKVDRVFFDIENESNLYKKLLIIEQGIDEIQFDFFDNLVDITQKHIDIKKGLISNDDVNQLIEKIEPFLNKNNVNQDKINGFLKYCKDKQNNIEKKYAKYYRLIYSNWVFL